MLRASIATFDRELTPAPIVSGCGNPGVEHGSRAHCRHDPPGGLDPIQPAFRDRMEIIRLSGYTEEEKLIIAQRHLVPRQIEENGLSK